MHRFYLPPAECKDAAFVLTGPEAHHASHVLRVKPGEQVIVLDGAGAELLCEVQAVGRDRIQLAPSKRIRVPPLPYRITLLQGIPRGRILETIIQKATELGAFRVVPLLSEHVATRLDGAGAGQKAEKWRRVAIEAIKQCGSAWLPNIEAPLTPRDFLRRNEKFDLTLIASLQPGSQPAREYFREFQQQHGRRPDSVSVWVGPEGDFTPDEVADVRSAGALPISLGRLVLRSETAAVYCLSILNHELQSSDRL